MTSDLEQSRPTISILAPCLNEELNVAELVRRCKNLFEEGALSGEIVLVDDGSTDGTYQVMGQLAADNPGLVVPCRHLVNRGIAAGWKTALDASQGRYVVTIDADLQYQPEDVLRLYNALIEHSVDVVQGWRSSIGRQRGPRYTLSRGLNVLLNTTFGMNLRDNKSGFVCCPREVFADLLTYHGQYSYWQSFIMVAAHAKGYSYRQVETLFEPRRQGQSFLDGATLGASVASFVDLGKAAWEYGRHRTPPAPSEPFLRRETPELRVTPPSKRQRPLRWRTYMAAFDLSHWMITRNVERVFETLHASQWLSREQLLALQEEKLQRLVRHAYRNVPYYRRKMQEVDIRPDEFAGLSDLCRLPLLSKDDVRKNLYFDITAENISKADMLRITTSGSTGEPFVCFADRRQLEFRWAATLRAQEMTGYRFGDPTVRLWHQTLGLSKAQSFREELDAYLANRTHVPVFEMSAENLHDMVHTIQQRRPVLIDGYAEALDLLAGYMKYSRRALAVPPKAVMSSAQTLPAQSRELIEQSFGCRVFDKYGSREFSGIAYECPAHDGLHTVAEGYIVEILVGGRPAKPGETGEVVITDLNNYGMPFIRYRIGDLATARDETPCSCGRGAPKIGAVQGRVQSLIVGTHGRYLPGTFFAHALKEFDYAIRRFQVIQDEPGRIVFKVVKAGRFSEGALDEALDIVRAHLGKDLVIDVQVVDDIEMVRTGKHMAAISRIPIDFQKWQ